MRDQLTVLLQRAFPGAVISVFPSYGRGSWRLRAPFCPQVALLYGGKGYVPVKNRALIH